MIGAVLVTAGLIVLVYAIVKAEASAGAARARSLLAALGVALLAVFVFVESRIEGPLVRLSIFKIRSLAVANVTLLLVAGGLFALFFFATLYVQQILGFTPIEAGLAFLPVTVGIGAGAGTAQVLVKKIGVRANAILGMVIAAVGLFLLSRIPVDGSYVSDLLPGLLLMSFGMGNTFVPITLIATTNVDEHDAGLASGLFNTSQQVGGALGPGRPVDARGGQDGELPARPWPPAGAAGYGGGAGGGLPGRLHVGGDPGHGRGDPARRAAPQSRCREREPGAGHVVRRRSACSGRPEGMSA